MAVPSLAVIVTLAFPGAAEVGTRKFTWPGETEYSDAVHAVPVESWTATVVPDDGIRTCPAGGVCVSVESRVPNAAAIDPAASGPARKLAAETVASAGVAAGLGPENVIVWYELPAPSLVTSTDWTVPGK